MRCLATLLIFLLVSILAPAEEIPVTALKTQDVKPPASNSPILTIGAGIEARMSRDVNPDANSVDGFGELYIALAHHPWSVLWEFERNEKTDNNGNYGIDNIEYTTMIWGRYEPWYTSWLVSPYFGAGLGYQLDDITSHFGRAVDTRWGQDGGIIGLSTGLTATFFQHWNVESEVRLSKIEIENGPTWSVLFRSGYTF
jgi:hypothetical protein